MFARSQRHLAAVLLHLMPDCRRVSKLLGESLDRPSTVRERLIMYFHNLVCHPCRRYLAQIRFLREAAQRQEERLAGGKYDVRLSAEAEQRLKNLLGSLIGIMMLAELI
jgi:hypothetical protein